MLGSKELFLNLDYKFGISMDLKNIEIVEIKNNNSVFGKEIILKIPKDKLEIEYLELITNENSIISDKTILTSQFKPEDIQNILDTSKNEVLIKIKNTKEIYYNAHENLKSELSNLMFKLGYDSVTFVY